VGRPMCPAFSVWKCRKAERRDPREFASSAQHGSGKSNSKVSRFRRGGDQEDFKAPPNRPLNSDEGRYSGISYNQVRSAIFFSSAAAWEARFEWARCGRLTF
jgi:hypothetical protein